MSIGLTPGPWPSNVQCISAVLQCDVTLCSSDTHSPSNGSAPALCIPCNYRHKATSRRYPQCLWYFTDYLCRPRSQLPNLLTTQLAAVLNTVHRRLHDTYKV
jgi:hypothetical protein